MITHEQVFNSLHSQDRLINLYDVAGFMGASLMSWDMERSVTSKITAKHSQVFVTINRAYEADERLFRFIAAHALGHLALGHINDATMLTDCMQNYRIPSQDHQEQEATRWGIMLLAPRESANEIIRTCDTPQESLCEAFKIPQQVARFLVANAR